MNETTLSSGIHHVTAITGNPQANYDFYTQVLGLRFVKKTVNFDDPSAYHFYYGDYAGRPGTIVTFFAWDRAAKGRIGGGETTEMSFAVAHGAVDAFWAAHLTAKNVPFKRDGNLLGFQDPDGIRLVIAETHDWQKKEAIPGSPVPVEYAISHIEDILLHSLRPQDTNNLLISLFGAGGHIPADVEATTVARGSMGAGTIHHVAFRLPDDETQIAWQEKLNGKGLSVSPVMDRQYFHSIYFREPGGVLFELATDAPGMDVDEPLESLGHALLLPPQYESRRAEIEGTLLPVTF